MDVKIDEIIDDKIIAYAGITFDDVLLEPRYSDSRPFGSGRSIEAHSPHPPQPPHPQLAHGYGHRECHGDRPGQGRGTGDYS
jgi:hypothetical protein